MKAVSFLCGTGMLFFQFLSSCWYVSIGEMSYDEKILSCIQDDVLKKQLLQVEGRKDGRGIAPRQHGWLSLSRVTIIAW